MYQPTFRVRNVSLLVTTRKMLGSYSVGETGTPDPASSSTTIVGVGDGGILLMISLGTGNGTDTFRGCSILGASRENKMLSISSRASLSMAKVASCAWMASSIFCLRFDILWDVSAGSECVVEDEGSGESGDLCPVPPPIWEETSRKDRGSRVAIVGVGSTGSAILSREWEGELNSWWHVFGLYHIPFKYHITLATVAAPQGGQTRTIEGY
ncbi:hypothetical protein C8Q78DRAFT_1057892 [Trametes maxima]|nr:hypothetical protein C8Q78DRAFT_1057892 [Trametes maxima]